MNNFVSILIPERNEEDHISECLDSIFKQTYPSNLIEVLIIDGMSTDRTREIIQEYINKYSFIKILDNHEHIVPCALNIGIEAAKGDVIIRMDAHTYYDKDYVTKSVETLQKVDAANVGGPIITLPGSETLVAEAIARGTSNSFGVGNSKFRTADKAQYVDTVAFGAFRREIFDKVGLFNEKLIRNQDIEFNSRIISSGEKIFLNPEIKSYYYNQSTLKGLWKQNFGNGKWNVFTLSLNPKALSLRHFIPLAFILSLIASLVLSLVDSIFIILFLTILILYIIANLIASGREAAKGNLKILALLPIVFGTLHFSYGIGYFWGLIRLRRFKKSL